MIKKMQDSNGNIVGFQATGMVTDNDYKSVLIPCLEAIITEHGKVSVLFDFTDDFHGYELAAVWDDTTFGLKHRNDFEKCAVVGGPKWVKWGTRLATLIISGKVKTFASNQLNEAWAWIKS